MKSEVNKSLILDKIKKIKGLSTDIELASFLDVHVGNIGNWRRRNSIDFDLIISKCLDVDFNLLFKESFSLNEDPNTLREPMELYGRSKTDMEIEFLYDKIKLLEENKALQTAEILRLQKDVESLKK